MTLTPPRTAIVIGDGVVGLNVALALQRRGTHVTIVAPDVPWRGASWGNAGHIAVEQVAPLASLATVASIPGRLFSRGGAVALPPRAIATWLPFSLRLLAAARPARFRRGKAALSALLATAIPAWRRVLDDVGAPGLLRVDGHFVVWETTETASVGRARWMAADIGTATVRDATPDELAQLAALADWPIAGAIRFDGSGQITDTAALGEALLAGFVAAWGTIVRTRAQSVAAHGDRARVALNGGGPLDADVAVIAAGAESGPLAASAGMTAPLIAERGYHVQCDPGDWPADHPPVVFEDRSMIVTRFTNHLRAAGFVEFARADTPPDPRKWDRLSTLRLPCHTRWMGARPTLPDYLPAIGRKGPVAYAFGHQHLGLTLAATTGDALAAELYGGEPTFDLAHFTLDRFR